MRINKSHIIFLMVIFSLSCHAQDSNSVIKSSQFLSKFGYRISVYSLSKFDSNVLRMSSGTSDVSTLIYPSLTLIYPISLSTKITAQYVLGLKKYVSTSFLNTNYNQIGLKIGHYFSPTWLLNIYGLYTYSNQPDILTTNSSVYRFQTFGQTSVDVSVNWLADQINLFSLEYSAFNRSYPNFYTLTSEKQKDFQSLFTLRWVHQFDKKTFTDLQTGFITNNSNNSNYVYQRMFLDAYLSYNLGNGYFFQIENVFGNLSFDGRKIRTHSTKNRQDILNTAIIGIKKNITEWLSLRLSYNFMKDFSNDNLRNFTSSSVNLGLQISFGKNSEYEKQFNVNQSTLRSNNDLNKEIVSAEQYTNTGYQYLLKGNYDKALEFSLRAISIDEKIEQAHINAGIAYYKKSMLKEAIAEWEKAIVLNPKNEKLTKLLEKAKNEIHITK